MKKRRNEDVNKEGWNGRKEREKEGRNKRTNEVERIEVGKIEVWKEGK